MKQQVSFYWYAIIVWRGKENAIIGRIKQELQELEAREEAGISSKQIKNLLKPHNETLRGVICCEASLTSKLVKFIYDIKGVIGFLEHTKNSPFLPKHINSEKIKKLLAKEENKESKDDSVSEELSIGDEVVIIKGSFLSYKGKVTRINSRTQEMDVDLSFSSEGRLMDNILLERIPNSYCRALKSNQLNFD